MQTSHTATHLPSVLYCSDEAFKTHVVLAEKLTRHLLDLARMLPEPKNAFPVNQLERRDQSRANEFFALLPEKISTADAIEKGKTIGMEKRIVEDRLRILCRNKSIVRISRGKYQKV